MDRCSVCVTVRVCRGVRECVRVERSPDLSSRGGGTVWYVCSEPAATYYQYHGTYHCTTTAVLQDPPFNQHDHFVNSTLNQRFHSSALPTSSDHFELPQAH